MLRFPDTMSRIHAATKPQVLGIMLLMLGVGLRIGSPGVIGMLVLIVILQFVTAPVSAHLTVRVAFRNAKGDDELAAERASRSRRTRRPTTARPRWRRPWSMRTRINQAGQPATSGSLWPVSRINEISNAYVADYARLSPMLATSLGLPGGEDRLDDLSPAGIDEVNELVRSTLRALDGADVDRHRRRGSPARSCASGSRSNATCTTRGGCTPT